MFESDFAVESGPVRLDHVSRVTLEMAFNGLRRLRVTATTETPIQVVWDADLIVGVYPSQAECLVAALHPASTAVESEQPATTSPGDEGEPPYLPPLVAA